MTDDRFSLRFAYETSARVSLRADVLKDDVEQALRVFQHRIATLEACLRSIRMKASLDLEDTV